MEGLPGLWLHYSLALERKRLSYCESLTSSGLQPLPKLIKPKTKGPLERPAPGLGELQAFPSVLPTFALVYSMFMCLHEYAH